MSRNSPVPGQVPAVLILQVEAMRMTRRAKRWRWSLLQNTTPCHRSMELLRGSTAADGNGLELTMQTQQDGNLHLAYLQIPRGRRYALTKSALITIRSYRYKDSKWRVTSQQSVLLAVTYQHIQNETPSGYPMTSRSLPSSLKKTFACIKSAIHLTMCGIVQ